MLYRKFGEGKFLDASLDGGRSSPRTRIGYHRESPGDSLESAITTSPPARKSFRFNKRQSIALVFCCTVFGAAGQMLIKTGANALTSASPLAMVTNLPLMAGYCLYGISAALLVLALRDGELSILYPVISLTYVWVTFLSLALFRETLNFFKLLGVAIIVTGVAILGGDGKKPLWPQKQS